MTEKQVVDLGAVLARCSRRPASFHRGLAQFGRAVVKCCNRIRRVHSLDPSENKSLKFVILKKLSVVRRIPSQHKRALARTVRERKTEMANNFNLAHASVFEVVPLAAAMDKPS